MLSFDEIQALENAAKEVGVSRRLTLASLTKPAHELDDVDIKAELLAHADSFVEYLHMMLELAQQAKERLS